jgi:hypothetical protein
LNETEKAIYRDEKEERESKGVEMGVSKKKSSTKKGWLPKLKLSKKQIQIAKWVVIAILILGFLIVSSFVPPNLWKGAVEIILGIATFIVTSKIRTKDKTSKALLIMGGCTLIILGVYDLIMFFGR